ncbi:nucleoside triphosphate pyrophosphohydrolase family protein [Photobacterium kishitanii]|uniref:SAM-dependent methyltransferase n=1 Tax=Photobacterium kishitanii TaxID=318456 RepID=A0A2T3KM30_9GAMM|nr:nucleoside triphosphate pyrophosphohydrolase family protein [Photobacterium kishitanii]PSV00700.1 SAM-dependent methyltransferase [Photobacterium kishitanii]
MHNHKSRSTLLTESLYAKLFADINDFREAFDLPVSQPDSFAESDDQLHSSLLIEEMSELATATTKIQIADALIDSVYVLVGRDSHLGKMTINSYLIDILLNIAKQQDIDFVKGWDIVHASNMSKLCVDEADFNNTKQYYKDLGVDVYGTTKSNGMIAVKCAKDVNYIAGGIRKKIKKDKVLKSVSYTEADLTSVC